MKLVQKVFKRVNINQKCQNFLYLQTNVKNKRSEKHIKAAANREKQEKGNRFYFADYVDNIYHTHENGE